jgi:hypothetical protein
LASERLALQGELQTGLRECDEASSQNQYSADCTTFIGMRHNRSHFCAPQPSLLGGPGSLLQLPGSPYWQQVVSTPQSPLPTIPAGYLLTIFLNNDSFGNVIKATFIVIDDQGNIAPPQTVDVAPHSAGDIAPVAYGQLVLVGMDNGETALLSSGAGMITYSSLGGFEFISQDPTGLGGTLERQQHLRLAADRPPISVCAIVPVLAKRSGIAKT